MRERERERGLSSKVQCVAPLLNLLIAPESTERNAKCFSESKCFLLCFYNNNIALFFSSRYVHQRSRGHLDRNWRRGCDQGSLSTAAFKGEVGLVNGSAVD